jgi:putative ABC transport system permease protein
VWQATDPKEHYWFYSGGEFSQVLLVPEETLLNRILPSIRNELGLAVWYWVMDPSTVQSSQVPGLLRRIDLTRRRASGYLPKIRLDISPEDALFQYQKAAQSLIVFLYSFSIPLMVMILVFVSLVMNMVIGQRRNEIAVLRSRGSTVLQLAGMSALESLILVGVGLAAGSPAGEMIAQLLGRARSFLDFSSQTVVHTQITPSAIRFGMIAGLIAIAAQVLPTLDAAQNTIVNYKRDRARSVRQVWWKRFYLDIGLLIPALYGIYLLRKGGAGLPNDPFQNPLLLLVPAMAIFAITLLILRILPLAMTAIAWLAGHTRSVGILMAARTLARTSGGYTAPLILLSMTLSLSTFTATMAQTLDHDTYDHAYYQVGSDINIKFIPDVGTGMAKIAQAGGSGQAEDGSGNEWILMPISDHLSLPGVQAAARVERTTVQMSMGGNVSTMNFIGIDRADFQQVAFWRRDFASQSLGALMNAMAAMTEGVLVSRDLMQSHGLRVGDGLFVNLYEAGESRQTPFQIVGVIDYFPTWYPSQGPLIVGSLDYMFDQMGSEIPYDVWIKTAPGADYAQVLQAEDNLFRTVLHTKVAPTMIAAEQIRPERQGFFGLLSVGFSALAIMSVIGFLLYALFSFRQRFIELGMLRAIGLSTGQMLVLLASELAFLFLTGLAAGTGLGAWISNMFIPNLQIGSDATVRVPPFVVQINWLAVYQIYALFAALFVVALVILTVMLMRMKIFQAIKLGDIV